MGPGDVASCQVEKVSVLSEWFGLVAVLVEHQVLATDEKGCLYVGVHFSGMASGRVFQWCSHW